MQKDASTSHLHAYVLVITKDPDRGNHCTMALPEEEKEKMHLRKKTRHEQFFVISLEQLLSVGPARGKKWWR